MNASENASARSQSNQPPLIAPDLLLSLVTGPVLLGLVASKAVAAGMREFGVFTEEIFRGDRLPMLTFPTETDSSPDHSESN